MSLAIAAFTAAAPPPPTVGYSLPPPYPSPARRRLAVTAPSGSRRAVLHPLCGCYSRAAAHISGTSEQYVATWLVASDRARLHRLPYLCASDLFRAVARRYRGVCLVHVQ